MNTTRPSGLPFSLAWLVLDLLGGAMVAAGVLALTAGDAGGASRFAEPDAGRALIGCGAALCLLASLFIARESRAGRRGR